jgi:hypothetical protein
MRKDSWIRCGGSATHGEGKAILIGLGETKCFTKTRGSNTTRAEWNSVAIL